MRTSYIMAHLQATWLPSLYVTLAIFNFASTTHAQVAYPGCGVTLTQRSGSIQFQSSQYGPVDCDYFIQQSEGFRITLTFLDFKRAEGTECHLDKIEIYDGPSSSSPKFGDPVCKTSSLPVLRSTHNSMWIRFRADANDTLPVSQISYIADHLSLELMLVTHYNKDTVYRFDLDTLSYTFIKVQTPNNEVPRSIAYDPVEERIYWSAVYWKPVKDSELLSSYLNGTEIRRIGDVRNDSFIDGIAMDWLTRIVVYVDSQKHVIAMMTINSSHHRVLINGDLIEPRKIALDVLNGVMFWADWSVTRRTIERANYDGSDRSIVATTTARPCSLAIDMKNGHIYWTQIGLAKVERSSLDGQDRTTIFNEDGFKFFGIALHKEEIFLTDMTKLAYNTNETHLQRISFGGVNKGRIYTTGTRLSDMVIYSSSDHVSGPNGCGNNNGGCSHICIPCAGKTRKCLCPDELHLSEDNRTCYSGTNLSSTEPPDYGAGPLNASIQGLKPFDTDGSRILTLTCNPGNDDLANVEYAWNVPCLQKQDGACSFKPQPSQHDEMTVTCTVKSGSGKSGHAEFTLDLNYPPTAPPEITGHALGKLHQIGERITMICSVKGGKPLVSSVIFSCDGYPDDSADVKRQAVVESVLQIDSVQAADNGSVCTCYANWKNSGLYNLAVKTILNVNVTQRIHESGTSFIVGVSIGGIAAFIIIVVVIIIIFLKINRYSKYDHPHFKKKKGSSVYDEFFRTRQIFTGDVIRDSAVYNEIKDVADQRSSSQCDENLRNGEHWKADISPPPTLPRRETLAKDDHVPPSMAEKDVCLTDILDPHVYLQPVSSSPDLVYIDNSNQGDYLHPAKSSQDFSHSRTSDQGDYLHPAKSTQDFDHSNTSDHCDYLHPAKPSQDFDYTSDLSEYLHPASSINIVTSNNSDSLQPVTPSPDFFYLDTSGKSDYLHPLKPLRDSMDVNTTGKINVLHPANPSSVNHEMPFKHSDLQSARSPDIIHLNTLCKQDSLLVAQSPSETEYSNTSVVNDYLNPLNSSPDNKFLDTEISSDYLHPKFSLTNLINLDLPEQDDYLHPVKHSHDITDFDNQTDCYLHPVEFSPDIVDTLDKQDYLHPVRPSTEIVSPKEIEEDNKSRDDYVSMVNASSEVEFDNTIDKDTDERENNSS